MYVCVYVCMYVCVCTYFDSYNLNLPKKYKCHDTRQDQDLVSKTQGKTKTWGPRLETRQRYNNYVTIKISRYKAWSLEIT